MNFLHPLFWLGLGALAVPVYLHLRRADRETVVAFAALRFLDDLPTARRAPLQLRQILLLLLRALAVLLLVAAFARPFFTPRDEHTTSSTVYLFDNTLSRQADPRWEDDKRLIARALRTAGPRQQTAVVELAGQPRVVVGWGDAPAPAATMVENLPPTHQRGAFLAGFRLANSLLQQSLGEKKSLVFLTDNQQNQWEESTGIVPFLTPGLVTMPDPPREKSRPNLSVSRPRVQRFFAGEKCVMQFVCEVRHEGLTTDPTVTLGVNGQEILRRTMALKDAPPAILLTAQWEADPAQWVDGIVRADAADDALAADNTVRFACAPLREGKVCLLSNSAYLRAALDADVSRGKWSAQILPPDELAAALAAPGTADADVLVLDASYLASSQARQLVDRYFAGGRGVFIAVDRETTLIDGALRQYGFTPKTSTAAAPEPPAAPLRFFTQDSPVFAPFKLAELGNVLEVRMEKYHPLQTSDAKPILFAQNGDAVLFEGLHGPGRLLVAAFGFDRVHTDWVIHPTFLPFLDQALQSLRPQPLLTTNLEPGETWLATVPRQTRVGRLHLRDGKREIDSGTLDASGRALIKMPDTPGNYRVTYDDAATTEQMVSVNPAPEESDLHYVPAGADPLRVWTMNAALGGSAAVAVPTQGNSPRGGTAEAQPWWWYVALAGLVALFAELAFTSTSRGALAT